MEIRQQILTDSQNSLGRSGLGKTFSHTASTDFPRHISETSLTTFLALFMSRLQTRLLITPLATWHPTPSTAHAHSKNSGLQMLSGAEDFVAWIKMATRCKFDIADIFPPSSQLLVQQHAVICFSRILQGSSAGFSYSYPCLFVLSLLRLGYRKTYIFSNGQYRLIFQSILQLNVFNCKQ